MRLPRRELAVFVAAAVVCLSVLVVSRSSHHAAVQPQPSLVDRGFVREMSQHHQQAVVMAELMDADADPQIRSLARTIETEQLEELGTMQGWASLWGPATGLPAAPMSWMPMTASMAGDRSMGMASQAELDRLRAATGAPRRLLFVELMVRHHRGAAPMLAAAAARATVPQVRSLAADEARQGDYEVGLMTGWLLDHH